MTNSSSVCLKLIQNNYHVTNILIKSNYFITLVCTAARARSWSVGFVYVSCTRGIRASCIHLNEPSTNSASAWYTSSYKTYYLNALQSNVKASTSSTHKQKQYQNS